MKCSIIIPFHSNKNLLYTCLDSLFATLQGDVEIIIIANNFDRSNIELDINNPIVQIITIDKTLYYSAAVNLGASKVKSEYLVFCDTDTVYTPNWLQLLLKNFTSHDSIGFASPMLLSPIDGRVIDFGIAFSQFNGPHPYKGQKKEASIVNRSFFPQAACSASGIIRREIFEKIGGFREELGYSYADIDLCLRLKDIGLRTLCVNTSHVFHKGNSVLAPMNSFIKSDVKARFTALNNDKIKIDLQNYYQSSYNIAKERRLFGKAFFMVDMSSVYDKEWYFDIFSQELGIVICDRHILPETQRDSLMINLYEKIPHHIQRLHTPIIYFVDEMISLRMNRLWLTLRQNKSDLVIDRNANIELLHEVIEDVC